jgi:hypothetical protein
MVTREESGEQEEITWDYWSSRLSGKARVNGREARERGVVNGARGVQALCTFDLRCPRANATLEKVELVHLVTVGKLRPHLENDSESSRLLRPQP